MGSTRTSFSLSPMSGGMTSMSGGMDQGIGARTGSFSSFGSQVGWGWAADAAGNGRARGA